MDVILYGLIRFVKWLGGESTIGRVCVAIVSILFLCLILIVIYMELVNKF